MLAVWRKASQFDPDRAAAAAWIFAIARNLRVDAFRRRRSPTLAADMVDTPSDEPGRTSNSPAPRRRPQLKLALRELPPEQVEVIRAAYFGDSPHSEIAVQLGLPLGTVSRVFAWPSKGCAPIRESAVSVPTHPSEDSLLGYATGKLAPGAALTVGAHVAACRLCAEEVAFLERIGGALLETTDADTVTPGDARPRPGGPGPTGPAGPRPRSR
jgi:hypothetical protein